MCGWPPGQTPVIKVQVGSNCPIQQVAVGAAYMGKNGPHAYPGLAPSGVSPGFYRVRPSRKPRRRVMPFSGHGNKLGGASSASKLKPLKKTVLKKKAASASKPKAAVVVVDDKWSCPRCTFLNEKEHLACGMCAGVRYQDDFTE